MRHKRVQSPSCLFPKIPLQIFLPLNEANVRISSQTMLFLPLQNIPTPLEDFCKLLTVAERLFQPIKFGSTVPFLTGSPITSHAKQRKHYTVDEPDLHALWQTACIWGIHCDQLNNPWHRVHRSGVWVEFIQKMQEWLSWTRIQRSEAGSVSFGFFFIHELRTIGMVHEILQQCVEEKFIRIGGIASSGIEKTLTNLAISHDPVTGHLHWSAKTERRRQNKPSRSDRPDGEHHGNHLDKIWSIL